jgi:hypothetical protein
MEIIAYPDFHLLLICKCTTHNKVSQHDSHNSSKLDYSDHMDEPNFPTFICVLQL